MPARSHVPTEILSAILDHLPFPALLPLRTVSETFLHLVNPRVFSKIAINLHESDYNKKSLMLIKLLSTSSSTVSSLFNTIRKVRLRTWCDRWEDKNILIDGDTPKAFLSDHLGPFLTRLPNLDTVKWTHHVGRNPSLCFDTIAQSLSCLAKLQNVTIQILRYDWNEPARGKYKLPPLHAFKNLSSLSVSYSEDISKAYYDREIATVVAASPKLTRFSLRNRADNKDDIFITESCTSLQTLFGKATSPQLTQLELRHIPLSAACLNQTLSLKLKSLTISTPIGSRHLKFAWAELFTTLEVIGVKLSQLAVTGMEAAMEEMFSYLTSYEGGLQSLKIGRIMMDCQDQEDKAGYRFWDEVVPHHKGSLKELWIYPWYDGEWCYGPAASAAISQCSSLRFLLIADRSVGSAWAGAKLSLTGTKRVIKSVSGREPYGHPENSAVSTLAEVSSSLAVITLAGTSEASKRADMIDYLNRSILSKCSPL